MATSGHGHLRQAIEVITRDNPLPLTCGLVRAFDRPTAGSRTL